jgi:DNA-binding transcriptional LysR family regulator
MRLNQIDLNLFLVLDAVYQQRNLTRAAEVLCITQPAVSNALGRLRIALDDPLFVRTSLGMVPTPFVETIVGRVQDALHQIDTCVAQEKQFDASVAKKVFRFSMNDLCEAIALPGLLSALGEQAPGIGVECYQLGRKEAARELASGSLDFALDVPLLSGPGLSSLALARQQYVCVVRREPGGRIGPR